jgi:rod shape-determining protein MreB
MLTAVLGLFSQDLAIDLGTSTTRIWMRGSGIVCAEPTVVAVHTDGRGRRKVLAVGQEALPMLGRTPSDIRTVQPVRDGQIHDYEVAEAFLLHLVRRCHGRNGWMSPRMVVSVPHGATEMERRAVRESAEAAGGRDVTLVSRPIAAAIGADLPVHEPHGHLIVDIGGGATEVAVLSCNGVVSWVCVQGGGEAMDEAIITRLRERHGLLVGRPTAEQLKIDLGTAVPGAAVERRTIAGRCLETGVPRAVEITSEDVRDALAPRIAEIAKAIRTVLERTPPELASDIVDRGVVLTGGGAQLRRLDVALRDASGLSVVAADAPAGAVVSGAGRALEQVDLLRAVAC